jgi:hypothetical protein
MMAPQVEPMTAIPFDESVGTLLLTNAQLIVASGSIHNPPRNIAIRVPHPDFEHGIPYTKHAEVSLRMTEPSAAC